MNDNTTQPQCYLFLLGFVFLQPVFAKWIPRWCCSALFQREGGLCRKGFDGAWFGRYLTNKCQPNITIIPFHCIGNVFSQSWFRDGAGGALCFRGKKDCVESASMGHDFDFSNGSQPKKPPYSYSLLDAYPLDRWSASSRLLIASTNVDTCFVYFCQHRSWFPW